MESQPTVNVALIQMSMTADAPANLARAADRISAAADAGANVVCLPELFTTPYFCQRENADNFDLAEPVDGPSTRAMATLPSNSRRSSMAWCCAPRATASDVPAKARQTVLAAGAA